MVQPTFSFHAPVTTVVQYCHPGLQDFSVDNCGSHFPILSLSSLSLFLFLLLWNHHQLDYQVWGNNTRNEPKEQLCYIKTAFHKSETAISLNTVVQETISRPLVPPLSCTKGFCCSLRWWPVSLPATCHTTLESQVVTTKQWAFVWPSTLHFHERWALVGLMHWYCLAYQEIIKDKRFLAGLTISLGKLGQ